jgi:flagellar biosynthesis protein FlhB
MERLTLYRIEKFLPIFAGGCAALLLWVNMAEISISQLAEADFWRNLFGPIFDFSTFFAASLFSIYVLALSRMEGFLGRIFNTKTFQGFHRYVSSAIALTILVSLWSAWYAVFGVADLSDKSAQIAFSFWGGFSVWAVFSVGRVVLVFLVLVSAERANLREKRLGEAS